MILSAIIVGYLEDGYCEDCENFVNVGFSKTEIISNFGFMGQCCQYSLRSVSDEWDIIKKTNINQDCPFRKVK